MTMTDSGHNLYAEILFSGYIDYWSGDGNRWKDNRGCLFATYGPDTTLRDLVDEWVDEFEVGSDCDTMPERITGKDIREALLEMLSDEGRADYESGALSECAIEFADANDLEPGAELSSEASDTIGEFPVAIVLLTVEKA